MRVLTPLPILSTHSNSNCYSKHNQVTIQVLIASQSGQFQQLEVTATLPQNKYLFEVDLAGSYCNAIDLSSTSKALG